MSFWTVLLGEVMIVVSLTMYIVLDYRKTGVAIMLASMFAIVFSWDAVLDSEKSHVLLAPVRFANEITSDRYKLKAEASSIAQVDSNRKIISEHVAKLESMIKPSVVQSNRMVVQNTNKTEPHPGSNLPSLDQVLTSKSFRYVGGQSAATAQKTFDLPEEGPYGPFAEGIWQTAAFAEGPYKCNISQPHRVLRNGLESSCGGVTGCIGEPSKYKYDWVVNDSWAQSSNEGNAKDYEIIYEASPNKLIVKTVGFNLTASGLRSPQRDWYMKFFRPNVMKMVFYFCGR